MGIGDNERILNKPTRHLERVFGDGSVLIEGVRYPVFMNVTAKAPTIDSTSLSTDDWTAIVTVQTKIVKWRLSEINGDDFWYAFVASPGDNFSIAYAWEAQNTGPAAIYVRRPTGASTLTIKSEIWTYD